MGIVPPEDLKPLLTQIAALKSTNEIASRIADFAAEKRDIRPRCLGEERTDH